jgi:hypothetical protein
MRCVFTADTSICVACANRGSECTEQKRELLQNAAVDSRLNLKDRIAKLEAIIESIALGSGEFSMPNAKTSTTEDLQKVQSRQLDNRSSNSFSSNLSIEDDKLTPNSSTSNHGSVSHAPETPQDIDPIVSLFNNAIVGYTSPL